MTAVKKERDLVERLREGRRDDGTDLRWMVTPIHLEAASEITRLQERVEELSAALEPFANAADGRRRKDISGGVCFRQAPLLRARAALKTGD